MSLLDPDNLTPLSRLREIVSSTPSIPGRSRVILLCTGSVNPPHIMHFQLFDVAAKFLREQFSVDSLAGFISPSCDSYLRYKLGNKAIPFEYRHQMCVLACQEHNSLPNSLHIECDPWEGSQKLFIDFPDVRDRLSQLIKETFPDDDLRVLYVCGADHYLRCGLAGWQDCVAIARPPYNVNTKSYPESGIYVCAISQEGYENLFSNLSSTEIRNRLLKKESLEGLVYSSVERYLKDEVVVKVPGVFTV
jgi:nicotinic acid mononucleotide adenylyltransferase